MNRRHLAFALFPLASFVTGCAGEIEARDAAYPQTIGYDAPQPQVASGEVPQAYPQQVAPPPAPERALPPPPPPAQGNGDVEVGAPPQAQSQGSENDYYAETDPAALNDFHGALDPYGTWADDSTYGTVWTPSPGVVGDDFAPYVSGGHWDYDDDYTWVSDYSWGWAPFHYGRWVYAGGRGWSWVPGRVYSGAWVSWRVGYDDWGYVGWAPMPPSWYWYGGVAYGLAVVPRAPFVFCPNHAIFQPHVGGYIVRGGQVSVVASHTRPFVGATPAVAAGGHVVAHPSVGPTPQSLHIAANAIPHSASVNPGVGRALAYARPSTATALGARAPAQIARAQTSPSSYGAVRPSPAYRSPSSSYAPPSHVPSRSLGSSFTGRSYGSYGGYSAPHYAPHYSPAPSYAPHYAPSPSYAPHASSPGYAQPHYGYSPSYGYGGSVPGYHPQTSSGSSSSSHHSSSSAPAPHASGGFHGGGGFRGGGGGFHGGGGHR